MDAVFAGAMRSTICWAFVLARRYSFIRSKACRARLRPEEAAAHLAGEDEDMARWLNGGRTDEAYAVGVTGQALSV
jgi:hypothetical protein